MSSKRKTVKKKKANYTLAQSYKELRAMKKNPLENLPF